MTGFSNTTIGLNSAQVGGYPYTSGGYVYTTPTAGASDSPGYFAPSATSSDVSTDSTDLGSSSVDVATSSLDGSSTTLDSSVTTVDSTSTTLDGFLTTSSGSATVGDGASLDSSLAKLPGSSTTADGSSNSVTGESTQKRYLGIDEQAVVEADGRRGMQVVRIYAGSAAERAGLQPGDVVHSANGYATQDLGNLTWIIDNAAAGNTLKLSVRSARDGQEYLMTAQL